jgi:hypothetical protein
VSLGIGRLAKKPKRPGWSITAWWAVVLRSRANSRLAVPTPSPPGLPVNERMEVSMPSRSMNRRLFSGDHGKFSGGNRQPVPSSSRRR